MHIYIYIYTYFSLACNKCDICTHDALTRIHSYHTFACRVPCKNVREEMNQSPYADSSGEIGISLSLSLSLSLSFARYRSLALSRGATTVNFSRALSRSTDSIFARSNEPRVYPLYRAKLSDAVDTSARGASDLLTCFV